MRALSRYFFVFLGLSVLSSACVTVDAPDGRDGYEREQARLEEALLKDPENKEVLQQLGEIHIQMRKHGTADEYLKRAFEEDPNDPQTLFYLGIVQEGLGNTETALRLYEKYIDVPRRSPYRRLMQGRHQWLTRDLVRVELRRHLASEDTLETDVRRLAVYPFRYEGSDKRFAPLGRGLADLLTNDFSQVPGLVVVERVRMQELMKELELSQTEFVDPAVRPRLGRLLGAGRVAGGSYNVRKPETLDVNAAVLESAGTLATELRNESGELDDFIRIEKALVFDMIDQMGIELTPQQRERIQYIPTSNFQAFLAYSRGLEEEDAGNYRRAVRHYRRASRIDPSFEEAEERAEALEGLMFLSGPIDQVIENLRPGTGNNLLGLRMSTLNGYFHAGYVPGQDARKPAQEPPSELPDPPPPPTRGN